jgi:hypothetical protein
MTNRNARLSGTIVSGSNEAFSARQPTIKHASVTALVATLQYTSVYGKDSSHLQACR